MRAIVVLAAAALLLAACAPGAVITPIAEATTLRVESANARCTAVLVAPTVALGAAHCFLTSGGYVAIRDVTQARSAIGRVEQVRGSDLAVIELLTPLPRPYARVTALPQIGARNDRGLRLRS